MDLAVLIPILSIIAEWAKVMGCILLIGGVCLLIVVIVVYFLGGGL